MGKNRLTCSILIFKSGQSRTNLYCVLKSRIFKYKSPAFSINGVPGHEIASIEIWTVIFTPWTIVSL